MIKPNLFSKIVLPILLTLLIGAVPIFYFIDKYMKKTLDNTVQTIMENDTAYIKETLDLKYKILFFISNKSKESYENNSYIAKRKMQELLSKHFDHSQNIVFIHTLYTNIPVSNQKLNQKQMNYVLKNSKEQKIDINSSSYIISKIDLAPFNWTIYHLYNLDNKKNSILYSQILMITTILFSMLIVTIILIYVFKNYIKKPNENLLEHFENISKGNYNLIDKDYNIKEIDNLVDKLNNLTINIQDRENKINDTLNESKSNNAYIKNILDTQKSIIITKDNNEEIKSVNSIFFDYFKKYKTLDEFKKEHKTLTDFFIKEDGFVYKRDNTNSWIEEIVNNPEKIHRVKLKINSKVYFFTINLVISKEFNHTVITLTDITNLEEQKATLHQYDKIINKSLMVSRTDLNGKILYANDELLKVSKYSREELIGHKEEMLRSPNTPKGFYDEMEKIIKKDKIWTGEVEKIDKYGNPFFVYLYLSPIYDANHDIIEYMYLRHDITDLINAQKRAKSAEESKSMFLASMSHEIRTPLNAIIGFTKILKKSDLQQKYKHYVNTIDKSAESLLALLNDILDISKIENNSLVLEEAEFNPFDEFNTAINLFYAKFNDKQINAECFIDPQIPQTLIGDSLRINQVLSNLISNAIKFTDKKGIISIRVELISKDDENCKIHFAIKDSGIGIPKDKQAHIFTPFGQAKDSTSRQFGGTGLGLDICSKIIKMHNSNIELQSQEGIGSKFSFTINFKIKGDDSISSKIKNIKTCIIDFPNIEHQTQYKNIKEYISSSTKNIALSDMSNIKLLEEQDIIFISEESINDTVINLANNGMKFTIFTQGIKEIDIKNSSLLSTPLDVSQLFNIFMETIGEETIKVKEELEAGSYEGKVLIAEDHLVNQELISILLDMRGINYVLANDGVEAIKEYKKDNFDLVLMDINMPNKDGIQATIDIKNYEKEQSLRQTPIIALTANALDESKEKITKCGMEGHLLKPLNEKELDRILSKFLKKSKSMLEDEISYDVKNDDFLDFSEHKKEEKSEEPYTIEMASEQMGIPVNMISKIVKSFTKNIDKDLDRLKEAINKKDFEEISNIGHKIKGASLNLKMDRIGNISDNLEQLGENHKFNGIEEYFSQLEKEVNYIKEYSKEI